MSSLYITEPPTHGKVMLQTTKGDIEIELWSKECPLACRNFAQLCLEGYYIDTVFHRVVPGFCIQAGDPTGTGTGGQSIWDEPFKDEFYSRLKYNRRGLLGMANTGRKHDNGSQFFITLAATPELQEKNTLFGRVVGNTIYNVDRIGKSELEADSDRPRYPTRIIGADVLVNPFDDIVPRTTPEQIKQQQEALLNASRPKTKVIGKNKLLSFAGDDEEQEESSLVLPKARKAVKRMLQMVEDEAVDTHQINTKIDAPKPPGTSVPSSSHSSAPKKVTAPDHDVAQAQIKPAPERNAVQAQIEALEASLRKRKKTSAPVQVVEEPVSALEQARRAYKAKALVGGRKARARMGEEDTLARLSSFQSRLASAKEDEHHNKVEVICSLHGVPGCASCAVNEPSEAQDEDDSDFLAHSLVFEKDRRGKDLAFKQRMEEELELIDPREKAGRLALEAREAKRRENEANGRNAFGGHSR
jgi:peptidyl-prolyl cis-trans isomerase SDCCAG10